MAVNLFNTIIDNSQNDTIQMRIEINSLCFIIVNPLATNSMHLFSHDRYTTITNVETYLINVYWVLVANVD